MLYIEPRYVVKNGGQCIILDSPVCSAPRLYSKNGTIHWCVAGRGGQLGTTVIGIASCNKVRSNQVKEGCYMAEHSR